MDKKFNNGLSNAQLERLAIFAEELGEATQAVMKIIRHGYENHNPHVKGSNNRKDLAKEIGHIENAIEMLVENNDIDMCSVLFYKGMKREIIKQWTHHQ